MEYNIKKTLCAANDYYTENIRAAYRRYTAAGFTGTGEKLLRKPPVMIIDRF